MSECLDDFDGAEYCDLCGTPGDDCHLIPDSGQLVCQSCIKEQMGQMRLNATGAAKADDSPVAE